MKMGTTIISILILLGSFGGGFVIGKNKADAKYDKVVLSLLEEQKEQSNVMYLKLDSLKNLPAKIKIVTVKVDSLIYKTDTLILMNKDIYQNTDTIKNELRRFVKK